MTLAASGRKAGSAKGQPSAATRSRLCGAELARRFAALARAGWGAASAGGAAGGWNEADGPAALKTAAAAAEAAAADAAAAAAAGGDGEPQQRRQTYAEAWAALRRPPSPFDAWLVKSAAAALTAANQEGQASECN